MRVMTWLGAAALVIASATGARAQCVGDCNNNGVVAVNELVIGVNILLEVAEVSACPSFDSNDNGAVAVNELVSGVNNLLNDSCPPPVEPVTATCTLGEGSAISIVAGVLNQTLPPEGTVEVTCAVGGGPCTCGVRAPGFGPLTIGGLFFACVKPAVAATCTEGEVDCDGGTPLSLEVTGNTDIKDNGSIPMQITQRDPCSGNSDCAAECAIHCGSAERVFSGACAGFCSAGTEGPCMTDADCLPANGACNGQDGVPLGNSCECTCFDDETGSDSAAGAVKCQLGFNLTVERLAGPACDGDGILINVGDTCAPLTTESVTAILMNANDDGGTLPPGGPFMLVGTAITCAEFEDGNASGMGLVGSAMFYGSTVGDIATGITAACE